MRWRLAWATGSALAGLAVLAAAGGGRTPVERSLAATSEAPRGIARATASPDPGRREHAARTAAVRAECGLDLATACRGGICASVVAVPDLDGPWGWAELALTSPRFVASTILRDHGVPSRGMPCGAAIASLLPAEGALGVDLPDGSEVWCAADEVPGARGLCDDLARGLRGPDAARFGGPRVRRMTLPD